MCRLVGKSFPFQFQPLMDDDGRSCVISPYHFAKGCDIGVPVAEGDAMKLDGLAQTSPLENETEFTAETLIPVMAQAGENELLLAGNLRKLCGIGQASRWVHEITCDVL